MRRRLKILAFLILVLLPQSVFSISFALDSIRTWGKFPNFCVNVYEWGDHFFNGYDTLYVQGTGTKFNIKGKMDSWIDYYQFVLPNKVNMSLLSDPSSSAGIWLTYMAVSVGYDKNVSKYFTGNANARKRFNFQFNCALFAAELYLVSNDVGTRIFRFDKQHRNIEFQGINTRWFGLDTYYFFNNKRYSQAAAFNYSRLQKRSQGSFYAGFSYMRHRYGFDFSSLPQDMKDKLPTSWDGYLYKVVTNHYLIKVGYGYNWAQGNWTLALSESPLLGLRRGQVGVDQPHKYSFSLSNRLRMSAVYNFRRLFVGAQGNLDTFLLRDSETMLLSSAFSLDFSVGYRFNIW